MSSVNWFVYASIVEWGACCVAENNVHILWVSELQQPPCFEQIYELVISLAKLLTTLYFNVGSRQSELTTQCAQSHSERRDVLHNLFQRVIECTAQICTKHFSNLKINWVNKTFRPKNVGGKLKGIMKFARKYPIK